MYKESKKQKAYLKERNENKIIVIDNGSNTIKIGCSEEIENVDATGALKPPVYKYIPSL